MEYVWSDNEDNWYESLEDLIDMMDLQEGDFVYKGEKITPSSKEFINTDSIIEQIQCSAYDNYGEHAEDYLLEVTEEREKELEELIFKESYFNNSFVASIYDGSFSIKVIIIFFASFLNSLSFIPKIFARP